MNTPCYLCEQYDVCSKTKRCSEWKPNKNLREFAIAELEKMKEKLLTELYMNRSTKAKLNYLINKEIAELKGEQK